MREHHSTLDEFRAKIRAEKKVEGVTYDMLAAKYGVNKFYLCSIVTKDDYEPTPRIAAKLGILVMLPAPACVVCGDVHTRKSCPNRKPNGRRHASVSLGKLTQDEREIVMSLSPAERREILLEAARKKQGD